MQNRSYNLNETACLEIKRQNRCDALDAIKRPSVAFCFSLSLYRFQISELFIFFALFQEVTAKKLQYITKERKAKTTTF